MRHEIRSVPRAAGLPWARYDVRAGGAQGWLLRNRRGEAGQFNRFVVNREVETIKSGSGRRQGTPALTEVVRRNGHGPEPVLLRSVPRAHKPGLVPRSSS